jgi:hypothetical protein
MVLSAAMAHIIANFTMRESSTVLGRTHKHTYLHCKPPQTRTTTPLSHISWITHHLRKTRHATNPQIRYHTCAQASAVPHDILLPESHPSYTHLRTKHSTTAVSRAVSKQKNSKPSTITGKEIPRLAARRCRATPENKPRPQRPACF